jgi:hypothetical protein
MPASVYARMQAGSARRVRARIHPVEAIAHAKFRCADRAPSESLLSDSLDFDRARGAASVNPASSVKKILAAPRTGIDNARIASMRETDSEDRARFEIPFARTCK